MLLYLSDFEYFQAHYRLSLLTTLHGISSHAPNHAQLTLMLESSALRLITGMIDGVF